MWVGIMVVLVRILVKIWVRDLKRVLVCVGNPGLSRVKVIFTLVL